MLSVSPDLKSFFLFFKLISQPQLKVDDKSCSHKKKRNQFYESVYFYEYTTNRTFCINLFAKLLFQWFTSKLKQLIGRIQYDQEYVEPFCFTFILVQTHEECFCFRCSFICREQTFITDFLSIIQAKFHMEALSMEVSQTLTDGD